VNDEQVVVTGMVCAECGKTMVACPTCEHVVCSSLIHDDGRHPLKTDHSCWPWKAIRDSWTIGCSTRS
jgi:hypothetical protein